ncbi:hypothetical protein [Enterovibrio norvegicus]|uniref:hypothetical protein n=1 Tax=Enterovibrio norvegicus TaxID=188144 RepID=UPI00354E0F97
MIAEIVKSHKDDLNPCLSCAVHPKLGYDYGTETKQKYEQRQGDTPAGWVEKTFNYELFTFYCPSCGFKSEPLENIVAAISFWHTTNTPRSEGHAERWLAQYDAQQKEKEQAA